MTRALFSLDGFRRGARDGVPLAVSIFAYGVGFGLVAAQAKFGVGRAVATSVAIHSGSAQLAAVNLLQTGEATLWALFATILVINARYLLFGATLQPWLWSAGPVRAYGSLLLPGDAIWLMTMRAIRAGEPGGRSGRAIRAGEVDRAHLAGTGTPVAVGWLGGTALGAAAASVLPRPAALGFDMMLACHAAGMRTAMVKTRDDLLPVVVGAGVAPGIAHLFGPALAIIGAGLAGAAVAALVRRGAAGRKTFRYCWR